MPTTDAAVRAISQHPTEHAEQCKLAMGSYSPQNLHSPNPKWFWQICHLFISYFTIYTNSTDLEINISFSNIYYLLDVDSTDELLEYSSEPKLVSRMDAAHTHTHEYAHMLILFALSVLWVYCSGPLSCIYQWPPAMGVSLERSPSELWYKPCALYWLGTFNAKHCQPFHRTRCKGGYRRIINSFCEMLLKC